ncbi:MAG: glycosyltransferase family 2 protein, partial [Bacteroidota bacterium]|nr:glycosyltransferase family 2 protein [Bacteroidota bacterium]
LSSTTYCLANSSATGAEYLVYDPSSSSAIVVDLSATSGNLNVEWFNPETGITTFSGTVEGGNVRSFKIPFIGDAILYIYDSRIQQGAPFILHGQTILDTAVQKYPKAILISRNTTIMISLFQYTLLIIFGFFIVYLCMLSILALFVKQQTSFLSSRLRKFCIIIPAHNEETSIERTLLSIFKIDYPRDRFDVVVIADNCTDKTAEIATGIGANVFERTNTELRGKGFALRWCFDKLLSENLGNDAFVVIDADSVASTNFLTVLNYYLDRGSRVIQATDVVEPQPGVWSSEMTRIGFLLYNYVRALGRKVINCPTGLHGNGMCFSVDIIKTVPWKAYSIAEDLEFGLQLLLHGFQTDFAPEAVVLATMPTQSANAKSQRARWEGGRFPVIRHYFFPLLRAAVQRRSYKYFDRLIDLITPALVNLLIVSLGMLFISSIITLIGIVEMEMFVLLWGIVSLIGFAHMFIGLIVSRADRSTYAALLYLPFYVLWKVSLFSKLFTAARSGEWVRTTRENQEGKKNVEGPIKE